MLNENEREEALELASAACAWSAPVRVACSRRGALRACASDSCRAQPRWRRLHRTGCTHKQRMPSQRQPTTAPSGLWLACTSVHPSRRRAARSRRFSEKTAIRARCTCRLLDTCHECSARCALASRLCAARSNDSFLLVGSDACNERIRPHRAPRKTSLPLARPFRERAPCRAQASRVYHTSSRPCWDAAPRQFAGTPMLRLCRPWGRWHLCLRAARSECGVHVSWVGSSRARRGMGGGWNLHVCPGRALGYKRRWPSRGALATPRCACIKPLDSVWSCLRLRRLRCANHCGGH